MPEASKIRNRSIAPSQRSVTALEGNVLALIGVFRWGPINTPVTLYGDVQATTLLGPYDPSYHGRVHLDQWFRGRGRKAVAVRVVDVDANGDPVTAAKATSMAQTAATGATQGSVTGTVVGPFALANGDTLVGDVDGVGTQTDTVDATAAARENGVSETFALANGQTLTVAIDGGSVQTITFSTGEFVDIANATAEEVAAVINAQIVGASATVTSAGARVTITSDTLGTASSVDVTGGTANTALTFTTGAIAGTGNVANVDSVTIAELKIIIEAAWTNGGGVTVSDDGSGRIKITANTAGASGSVQVDATSTADTKLGLDNAIHAGTSGAALNTLKLDGKYYGTLGNDITYTIRAASNGNAEFFDLLIYLSGKLIEPHLNLTMDTTSDDFVDTRLNLSTRKSEYLETTDQSAAGTATQRRPANVTSAALSGGNDGLAGLSDSDYTGTQANAAGLHALDGTMLGNMLCIPDAATTTVQAAAILYCETERAHKTIFIPEAPIASTYSGANTHADTLASSEAATGVLWPWVKVANPDKSVYGANDTLTISAGPTYAARMARNATSMREGEFSQPGNPIFGRLDGIIGIETDAANKDWVREAVADHRINPIRFDDLPGGGKGAWVDDVQALTTTGNFQSVGEIRGVSQILRDVENYLEIRRTQGNTEKNRREDKMAITGYLEGWTSRNVFASQNADEAFYVVTDPEGKSLNNAAVRARKEYQVLIGLGTAEPGRIITLLYTRDAESTRIQVGQTSQLP